MSKSSRYVLSIFWTFCLALPGCHCPDTVFPRDLRNLEINPHPPGWPNRYALQCCGDAGQYEFASTYSWAAVVVAWSSPKKLEVTVALAHCEPRDAADCSLSRVVNNETEPDPYGFFRSQYQVSGGAIRVRVTMTNPQPASANFGLTASEQLGYDIRPFCPAL